MVIGTGITYKHTQMIEKGLKSYKYVDIDAD